MMYILLSKLVSSFSVCSFGITTILICYGLQEAKMETMLSPFLFVFFFGCGKEIVTLGPGQTNIILTI